MRDDEWDTAPPGSAAGYDRLMEDYSELRSNRWAAFTDDELDGLMDSFYQAQPRNGQIASDLRREIKVEIEGRAWQRR